MPKKTAKSNKIHSATAEGISITPIPATEGDTLNIAYDGLLTKSGALTVYAHLGYGSNDNWVDIEDIAMRNIGKLWTCDILPKDSIVNFCFHDGANNWDNNYGRNWSISIHDGGNL